MQRRILQSLTLSIARNLEKLFRLIISDDEHQREFCHRQEKLSRILSLKFGKRMSYFIYARKFMRDFANSCQRYPHASSVSCTFLIYLTHTDIYLFLQTYIDFPLITQTTTHHCRRHSCDGNLHSQNHWRKQFYVYRNDAIHMLT